jgi:CheY-like chemotaxis protein
MPTILLADDSITIQKIVNLTFSGEGIDVVTVGNGEAAVKKIHELRPALVLADIFMPGKNGYEVCDYIKSDPSLSPTPVILLVGAFEPFDSNEAAREGRWPPDQAFRDQSADLGVNRLSALRASKTLRASPRSSRFRGCRFC